MSEAMQPYPTARIDLAARATYEIEEILTVIQSNALDWLRPTLMKRIAELNSVIMSIVGGDDERETAEMSAIVDCVKRI